ncbi:MAG: YvcK family protein [Dehalococcoidia bacterium]|nr:YvcK family protein [Dehalococcoidia bacterium]
MARLEPLTEKPWPRLSDPHAPEAAAPIEDEALKIVAIGGGSGQANLLRGLKLRTSKLSSVVTVADDGGSSGRLRRDMGVLPPGDVRRCILALANAEPLMERLFQYRFEESDGEGIKGHSFGNLFIVAMSRVAGSMEAGIRETARVLAVDGAIHPSTLEDVILCARMADDTVVCGESAIPKAAGPISEVWLEPTKPPVNQDAADAILDADVVVIGPGSLYTSIIPNLLVPGIRDALQRTSATKLFVVNVATQPGETDGFDAARHYQAASEYMGDDVVDFVLANNNHSGSLPSEWHTSAVVASSPADFGSAQLVLDDLIFPDDPYRHDSDLLADLVVRTAVQVRTT